MMIYLQWAGLAYLAVGMVIALRWLWADLIRYGVRWRGPLDMLDIALGFVLAVIFWPFSFVRLR